MKIDWIHQQRPPGMILNAALDTVAILEVRSAVSRFFDAYT